MDSFDYIKIKNFYSSEDSIKRQATEREKIFATHSLRKDSHSEYVKNSHIRMKGKKTTQYKNGQNVEIAISKKGKSK